MSRIGIAVAGASCSGKTTLANAIASELDATLLRIDDYYRPLDHLTYDERCLVNFDDPAAIDSQLLVSHVALLLRGEPVEAPMYDFTRHTRFAETQTIDPASHLIVEGLFSLSYPGLASLCPIRVFVEAACNVCLERRLVRDTTERGRTPEEVVNRFQSHVWPMYCEHVQPCRCKATLCVSGEEHLDHSLAQVLEALNAHRPLQAR